MKNWIRAIPFKYVGEGWEFVVAGCYDSRMKSCRSNWRNIFCQNLTFDLSVSRWNYCFLTWNLRFPDTTRTAEYQNLERRTPWLKYIFFSLTHPQRRTLFFFWKILITGSNWEAKITSGSWPPPDPHRSSSGFPLWKRRSQSFPVWVLFYCVCIDIR